MLIIKRFANIGYNARQLGEGTALCGGLSVGAVLLPN